MKPPGVLHQIVLQILEPQIHQLVFFQLLVIQAAMDVQIPLTLGVLLVHQENIFIKENVEHVQLEPLLMSIIAKVKIVEKDHSL